ncbi:MAG: helix-turn-helix domain-containing protein [Deltaproteobacteria bacterium]|nr:helix-turn-helix domain-containing protein [Deltaproteobacteria bacterium]
MTAFRLNYRERQGLENLARHATEAIALRRTQALLWRDGGESVQQVADRLRVSRQAVYTWLAHFQARQAFAWQTRSRQGA